MKRRVSALLLALTLAVSLASGAFAATYSNWFKSNYQEMQNLKILPDQFTGMDLKQPITRGEMCLLAVQAFEEATGNDLELDGTQYFTDTNDTNITKAYEYGIFWYRKYFGCEYAVERIGRYQHDKNRQFVF